MPSVLAIVSKKVFEKECASAKPGALYATELYASTHKALDALADGGSLFLATVRPPDEALWLVAILERPKKTAAGWAAKNAAPICDVTAVKSKIRFSNGSGITDKKGALGMSLQTPRTLTEADETILRAALGGTASAVAVVSAAPVKAAKAAPPKPEPPPPPPAKASPAKAAPPPDELLFFNDEARRWLEPRTADQIATTSTPAAEKRRTKTLSLVRAQGGFERVIEAVISGESKTPFPELAALLLAEPDDVRRRCEALAEKAWPNAGLELKRLLVEWFHRPDWAAELTRDALAGKIKGELRELVFRRLEDPELVVAYAKKMGPVASLVNVSQNLRERAVPALAELLDAAQYPNEEKAVSRALACIGTPEAAATFAKHLRRKNVRPFATEFYAHFPHLAQGALAELAAKRTQVGGVAKDILARLERTKTAIAAPVANVAEADASALPEILRTPPWLRKPKKRAPLVVEGLEVPTEPTRLHWSERARRAWVAAHYGRCGSRRGDEEVNKLKRAIAEVTKDYVYGNYPAEIVIPLLAKTPANLYVWNETPMEVLALHGERAVAAFASRFLFDRVQCSPSELLRVESPMVAAGLARFALSRTHGRASALHWVERYPEAAAKGLIPVAVGKEDWRDGGELGLRWLVRLGHRELVLRVAKDFGAPTVAAVQEILAWDERDDGPEKAPKMTQGYRPTELRAPRLKNGDALPQSAMETLDLLLRTSDLAFPIAGLDEVRDAMDPRSLAEHAWDLAKSWDIEGAKESLRWMLHAVAHLGDDEVVRRLTPALKGEGIAPMLGVIGTDAALMELVTILARVTRQPQKRPKYSWGTEAAIDLVAARRGLETDEILDRFVPTCEVDDDGGLDLDLGGRTIRLTFDHRLVPVLKDENGATLKALPKTGVEPDKLAAATTLLADLDEDVAAIATLRSASLESAMLHGRRWSLQSFTEIWVQHPLMRHLATGVVWEALAMDGTRLARFRIAEDGSYAGANDDAFSVPANATHVGVAHPARFTTEEREAWRALFVDYELLQPFDQLAREPCTSEAALTRNLAADPDWRELGDRLKRVGWSTEGRGFVLPFETGRFGRLSSDKGVLRAWTDDRGTPITFADSDPVERCELARAITLISTS